VKTLILVALFVTIISAAIAQDTTTDSSGPGEKGATGWSGGSRKPADVATGQRGERSRDERDGGQPPVATGRDLAGPPRQLRPAETPE